MYNFNPIAVVKKINSLANKYNDILLNKNIKYVYRNPDQGGRSKSIILRCNEYNFMHLCGVDSYVIFEPTEKMLSAPKSILSTNNSSKNAKTFFLDALSNRLNPNKIIIKNKFYKEKMSSLSALSDILNNTTQLCDKKGVYLNLKFERSIRTSKSILALGLIEKKNYIESKEGYLKHVNVHIPITNIFLKYNVNDPCFKSNTTILHIILLNDIYQEKEYLYSLNKKNVAKKKY